jgi:hypothetical protein
VNTLKREDAFYYKNLLMLGFFDGYDDWLNYYLKTEDPLSEIVLSLSYCGSNVKDIIPLLDSYCSEEQFDKSLVVDRLRLFFKDAYHSDRMTKKDTVSAMYRLSLNNGDHIGSDFDFALWGDMYELDEYYSMAEEGVISWESFDYAFLSYLDNGTPIDSDHIYKMSKKKLPLFERIKRILKK